MSTCFGQNEFPTSRRREITQSKLATLRRDFQNQKEFVNVLEEGYSQTEKKMEKQKTQLQKALQKIDTFQKEKEKQIQKHKQKKKNGKVFECAFKK